MTRRYTLHKDPAGTPSRISYEKELNPEQLQVVTSGPGPALVLAGPGSGKTRTLTYRVAYLLEQGIPARSILLVTFTVKAAREMLERVETILKAKPEGLWGGTFHHIGNLVLRRHAALLQRTPSFGILDGEDAEDLLSAIVADMKAPSTHIRMPQSGVIEKIFSMATNTCRPLEKIVLELYPQFSEQIPWMEKVRAAYHERKRQANVFDYDDLMSGWLTLLRDHPAVRQQYEEQFQYILVDEYQDTNRLQFELIRALGSGHKNILAVGDDAQSIYGFRGADVRNLLQFPQIFPGAAVYRLETNYRSTPEILRLANTSISFNTNQFPKELKSVQGPGSLPVVVPLADARQQAAFIAQRALELREEGTPLEEMAVLFRARFQAAELELELAKRNIPYVVRGGIRFFEQAHIKDVLAYLRILSNPNDELAWERVLRLQDGIGAGYAKRIREALVGSQNPLQAALGGGEGVGAAGLPSKAQASWKRLRGVLGQLAAAGKADGPAGLLLIALKTGYESYLQTHFEDARDRREDLEQLLNLASGYTSVEKFIEDLTLREPFRGESIRGWEEPDEVLVLSTVHQAKGLEWTAVFLIGLADGQFPHQKSAEDPAQMEEERRLFYVAVTRAKRDLYLTHPMTRYNYQRGETILRPSQFLQELPETLLELWRVGGEEIQPPELELQD